MDGPAPDADGLTLEGRRLLAGEILGAPVTVVRAPGTTGLPLNGVLVGESLHMLDLRVPARDRPLRLPKAGLEGTIVLEGRELPLRGDLLRMRPEDRTKRLLVGGSGRPR